MDTTQEKKYESYVESDAVRQAKAALDAQLALKPGAYQSPWQSQLNETFSQIQNRDPFKFDMNGSTLWNQYKDRYVQQGRQAMMDTMGQAAALTGGYGNSYAQSVGQQTYQGYLQGLNDKLGEIYQMDLDRYNQEGADLYNLYGLLSDQEDRAYGLYRDAVSDYNAELDRVTNRYDTERSWDYGQYRDAVADQQWQTEYDEAVRQWNLMHADLLGGSSSGGSGGGGGSSYRSASDDVGTKTTNSKEVVKIKDYPSQSSAANAFQALTAAAEKAKKASKQVK